MFVITYRYGNGHLVGYHNGFFVDDDFYEQMTWSLSELRFFDTRERAQLAVDRMNEIDQINLKCWVDSRLAKEPDVDVLEVIDEWKLDGGDYAIVELVPKI